MPIMRGWVAETKLRQGRLNEGQKAAVKTILAGGDRVISVQGYDGTSKTKMLKRLRVLAESRGHRVVGLAPSAYAAMRPRPGSRSRPHSMPRPE